MAQLLLQCLASYTAAGIAGADSLKTGFTGFMYALVAFLVPFVFVYNPELLLMGTPAEIAKATAILFFGTYLLAGAISGYMVAPLTNSIGQSYLLVSMYDSSRTYNRCNWSCNWYIYHCKWTY